MSGVSFPVSRPVGRALVVGNLAFRTEPAKLLRGQGFDCAESDDAYAAMLELCRHRLTYNSLIICLASFYREELDFISTVKRRFPHVEIWLTQTDGRMGALVDAMNLGADGLLAEDGTLHRLASQGPAPLRDAGTKLTEPVVTRGQGAAGGTELLPENEVVMEAPQSLVGAASQNPKMDAGFASVEANGPELHEDGTIGEPVLTADELRALLQDQPSMPPSAGERDA